MQKTHKHVNLIISSLLCLFWRNCWCDQFSVN